MPQVLPHSPVTVDQPAPEKMTDLPVMSSAELCALGALRNFGPGTPAWTWWDSQNDQDKLTQMALSSLARRQLRDPGTGRVSPPLGLIHAGLTRPSFILTTREKPSVPPHNDRGYGICDESGTHSVLLERCQPNPGGWDGPAHHFRLNGIDQQAAALTDWAAGRKRRTIDLYLPGAVGFIHAERLVFTPARHGQVTIARKSCGTTFTFSRERVARLVAGLLNGVPR